MSVYFLFAFAEVTLDNILSDDGGPTPTQSKVKPGITQIPAINNKPVSNVIAVGRSGVAPKNRDLKAKSETAGVSPGS